MSNLWSELRSFAGFVRGLPAFARRRMTYGEARDIVLRRLEERDTNFLAALEGSIFDNPRSPYRALMAAVDCAPGDVRTMVRRDGIEATLRALRAAGVYVSFEEFKGRQPIERNGRVIPVRPGDFDNPTIDRFHTIATGGSTGSGRRVLMDIAHLEDRLPLQWIFDTVAGMVDIPTAFWFEIPPGNGLDSVLLRIPMDNVPERWFAPIYAGRDGVPLRFRLATRVILQTVRWAGARVPSPEHVGFDQAHVIARWMAEQLDRHGACGIRAHVSKALRVCLAAREAGIDLTGAIVCSGGEPPTPTKVREIRSTGARFRSDYYFAEAGPVGMGCVATDDPADLHFLRDHLAVIQHPRTVPGFDVTVDAFHFTSLLPTAPKVLLNVESDDYGVLEQRPCGCLYGELGFTDHILDVRSFRKLTGEGVTLIGSEMERILEDELPARFGGTPLDYQLVEEEDERGFTRLTLRANPTIPGLDESAVIEHVLRAMRRMPESANPSRAIWSQAGSLRVRREAPQLTARGKLLPLRFRDADRSPVGGNGDGTEAAP